MAPWTHSQDKSCQELSETSPCAGDFRFQPRISIGSWITKCFQAAHPHRLVKLSRCAAWRATGCFESIGPMLGLLGFLGIWAYGASLGPVSKHLPDMASCEAPMEPLSAFCLHFWSSCSSNRILRLAPEICNLSCK